MTYLFCMHFSSPVIEGRFIKRYKRFLVDVRLPDGAVITAHCPNSGAMRGVQTAGARVWLSYHPDAKRAYAHTLESIEADGTLVGVNTQHPNRLVAEALALQTIPELAGYTTVRREVACGDSRLDFCLAAPEKPLCYVEVKNVHWRRGDNAVFPDSVTQRGAKHLNTLADLAQQGHRAVIFYVVQRSDCMGMTLADDIDPTYAKAFAEAQRQGVEALCYGFTVTPTMITLPQRLVIA